LFRLDRLIADHSGYSRSEVKKLLRGGAVAVDGTVETNGERKLDPGTVSVRVDGTVLDMRPHRYLIMNKPAGVVSSTDDPRDRTALDLLPETYRRFSLFPAGRLDKDAEGLLLLTDDGQFCHNVISPKKNVRKIYYIETEAAFLQEDTERFASGLTLSDGSVCRPAELRPLRREKPAALVAVCEGKYHQVKRMAAAVGKPVTYLRRVAIGALALPEGLEPGHAEEIGAERAASVFLPPPELATLEKGAWLP